MANLYRDLRGTLLAIFQIGLGQTQIRATATELQARDVSDADYCDFHMQDVILQKAASAFKLTVQSPTLGSDQTLILPAGGTIASQTGMHYTKIVAFNQASGATFTLDSAPPVNSTLAEIRVLVDVAAAGSNPTMSIGVAGTVSRDQATTDNNLKVVGQYIIEEWLALGATPAAIIATLSAAGQTFSGRIALTYILA